MHIDFCQYRAKVQFLAKLKAKKSHFRSNAELCGSDEEQPLCEEVTHEYKIVAVWYRFHELVPCQDEVGKYEKYRSEGEDAAALEHCSYEHGADDYGIYAYADADYAGRSLRGDYEECCAQDGECAEHDHCKIAFGLCRELSVRFDLAEISSGEICDVEYVAESEESHLSEEVVAGSHMVAQGREQQGEGDLPWAKPQ